MVQPNNVITTSSGKRRWVLLRGLIRESAHWGSFRAYLETAFPQDQFYVLDLPGCGTRCSEVSSTSLPVITDQVRLEARKMGVFSGDPVILIAMSLGGIVAIDWLRRYSSDFAAAVLINTSLREYAALHQRLSWKALLFGLPIVLSNGSLRERLILNLTANHATSRKAAYKDWVAIQKLHPVVRRTLFRQLLAAATYHGRNFVPEVEALFVCSKADRIVSWHCSRELARAWKKKLVVHPHAGHDIALDDPAWLLSEIKSFVLTLR